MEERKHKYGIEEERERILCHYPGSRGISKKIKNKKNNIRCFNLPKIPTINNSSITKSYTYYSNIDFYLSFSLRKTKFLVETAGYRHGKV